MWDPSAGQPGMYFPGGPMSPLTSGYLGFTNLINTPLVNPAYPPGTFPGPPGCFPGNLTYPLGTAIGPGQQPGYPGCLPPGPSTPPGHYPPLGPSMLSVNSSGPGVVGPGMVMDKKIRKKMKKAHKKMHKHHKHGKHSSTSFSSSNWD